MTDEQIDRLAARALGPSYGDGSVFFPLVAVVVTIGPLVWLFFNG